MRVTGNMKELNKENVFETIEELNGLYSDIRGVLEPLAKVVREDTLAASDEEKPFILSIRRIFTGRNRINRKSQKCSESSNR